MAFILPDNGTDIILIDCPRKKQCNLEYELLEDLKNGEVLSEKYEVKLKSFESPHVIALMNRIPKIGKMILSGDRCIIKEISLTPEEKEHLRNKQEESCPAHTQESLERTREIMEVQEEEKQVKRAHTSFSVE